MEEGPTDTKSSKKKYYVIGIVAIVVVALVVATILLSIFGNVKVNGVSLSNRNIKQDFETKVMSSHSVFLEKKYNTYTKFNYDLAPIENRNFIVKAFDAVFGRNNYVPITYTVNKEKLEKAIRKDNKKNKKPKDAKIVKGEKFYEIKPAQYGTKINIKGLFKALKKNLEKISVYDYLQKPKIVDKDLEPVVKALNKPMKWHITYKNGAEIRHNFDTVKLVDGEVNIDENAFQKVVYKALATYDTIGGTWTFKDHKGKKKKVTGGTWGSAVNYEKEMPFIKEAYSKKKSHKDRKPYLLTESPKNFTKKMIEVSISKQHLWMYKGKKLICQSDVVTGLPTKEKHTPPGVYYVTEKKNGTYLKGPGYKTWVDYWMRLTPTGIGLHDAPWQPTFGGSRYLTGGSHGCINLPAGFAASIYKKVDMGMTVIITK